MRNIHVPLGLPSGNGRARGEDDTDCNRTAAKIAAAADSDTVEAGLVVFIASGGGHAEVGPLRIMSHFYSSSSSERASPIIFMTTHSNTAPNGS